MNESTTLFLYISIIIITFIFGCNAQKHRILTIGVDLTVFNKAWFALAFIIPWFFYAFAGISNDYSEYRYIFDTSNFSNFNSLWIEPGYALLNACIKIITPDSKIALVLIKSIIFVLIYKVIYDYREKVPIGMALLGYMCIAYLDSFCMVRIHLAAAIVLLAVDLYDNRNKKILSALLVLIALSIHYSTFIFVLAVIVFIICARRDRISPLFLLGVLIALIIVRLGANNAISYLTSHIGFLSKYGRKYTSISKSGSGLVQYLLHAPFLLVFYDCWGRIINREFSDTRLLLIGLILTPFSLFFGTMGYTYEVIGRSFVFFLFIWMILLPRYYAIHREDGRNDWLLTGVLVFCWLLLKLFIYIQSGSLASSGIGQYYYMWQVQ